MIENRPLVRGEDDFIYHITDLISATNKGESDGQHGNRLENMIEEHAIQHPGSYLHVCHTMLCIIGSLSNRL
jgi:hypothetical protein